MERRLLLTSDFPPRRGGVARMLFLLARHVPWTRVEVVKEDASYRDMLWRLWHLRRRYDSVFVSHVLPIGIVSLLGRIFLQKPYDVLLHGLDFDLAKTTLKKKIGLFSVLFFARNRYANSHALAIEVAEFAHRRCKVLYPCVSDVLVEASAIVQQSESDHLRVLTVGRLVERKDHLRVLLAMKDLPNVTYTIVGDGPMRSEILRTVTRLGLSDRVTMLQHVRDEKLPEIYASHDVFVMPTKAKAYDREGFGTVFLEAGLFGLPVIGTRCKGVDEAIIDDETGILLTTENVEELRDALIAVQDDSLRQRLGQAGKDRVKKQFLPERTFATLGATHQNVTMQFPRISAIVPTFQHGRVLAKCLDALLAQTYKNLEIIVVNDGSTDNTAEVLERYHSRVRVIFQENQGGNPARNRGLRDATGELVIFVDADVVLAPAALDEMYAQLAAHEGASFVYTGFYFGWKRFRALPWNPEVLKQHNYVMTTSLVWKRDFPGFDPNLKRLQDWDVWLTMLEAGKYGVPLSGIWFHVRIDGASRTGSSWLPAFMYALPWPIFGYTPQRISRYRDAHRILAHKHHLPL